MPVAAKSAAVAAPDIEAREGDTLSVSVIVDNNHLVPYQVSWKGTPIIDSLVSASATVGPLVRGRHRLLWRFTHGLENDWSHEVSVALNDGAPKVLESKSREAGDAPNSGDASIVVVS